MMKKIIAHASGKLVGGETASRGRGGSVNRNMPMPRAGETMGEYYRRTGASAMGANRRTRGVARQNVVRTRG